MIVLFRNGIFTFLDSKRIRIILKIFDFIILDEKITSEDLERVKLLEIVSKKGLKELNLDQLKKLQILVEKKDYSHSNKARKSKIKLLARINVAIYEAEEDREGI